MIEESIFVKIWLGEKFGNSETPETTGLKGDKLWGISYVEFDKIIKLKFLNSKNKV